MNLFLLVEASEALNINYSLVVVMILFVVYHLLMKVTFYRPLFKVMEEREARTDGALELASRDDERRRELLEKYEQQIRQARVDGYEKVDAARQQALARRSEEVAKMDLELREQMSSAKSEIETAFVEQKAILEEQTRALAEMMADRVLSRELSQ
jgi:F-type H+-transporting ATPase subunit b